MVVDICFNRDAHVSLLYYDKLKHMLSKEYVFGHVSWATWLYQKTYLRAYWRKAYYSAIHTRGVLRDS